MSDGATSELPGLGQRLCRLDAKLSTEALGRKDKLWKVTPKLHIFQHLCEWQGPELGNPAFYWVYAEVDLVGQMKEVAEACRPC